MTINLAAKFVCNVIIRTYIYVHEYIKVVFKTLCILYLFIVVDYSFSSIQQFILPHINKILFSVCSLIIIRSIVA